jgi:hypothetical protein
MKYQALMLLAKLIANCQLLIAKVQSLFPNADKHESPHLS